MKDLTVHSALTLAMVAVLLLAAGCTAAPHEPAGTTTETVPATTPAANVTATSAPATLAPVPSPTEMFPGALALKQPFTFGTGDVISEGTVYRYWLNDTYQWRDPIDNRFFPQVPPKGDRYLFVFIDIVNRGNTRVWPPVSGSIHLWYAGKEYRLDPEHALPDQIKGENDMTIRIGEIQYYRQLYSSELVTDYGYSHGKKLGFLYPGESNALDGYLIYVVPASLAPNETYVQIAFNGNDTAVWKLA